ncbi:hypothetical protein J2X65_001444 [Ancylobacter sp. 3268]|uniref:hypothetical protein n=1 Tax=Ancylobacter sp. 3268 TaxID=2817752 RepID=UPI002859E888|nr:hypothetical protein [Ancylobacter sp. 3268]MDR6952093.1 hypothetical protein [Ancylobacter sp. 3268]
MGLHLAVGTDERAYLVIGGEVAVAVEEIGTPIEPVERVTYLTSSWLRPDCPRREELFEEWLDYLWPTPELRAVGGEELGLPGRGVGLRVAPPAEAGAANGLATAPANGGQLPFATRSQPGTIVYRWEPFPVSRRCRAGGSMIAAASFAAPEQERPFMPSGFAAASRLAWPSLLPACFLYALEPAADSAIECGAVGPMPDGGVKMRFPHATPTRAMIAAPAVLPPL